MCDKRTDRHISAAQETRSLRGQNLIWVLFIQLILSVQCNNPLTICLSQATADGPGYSSKFVAPATFPTTLYRLEKKVFQSFSVDFSFSSKSFQSACTSSAFVELLASARDASLPANTL